jgi:formate-dependent nitrite reductase membrane component NrfD
MSWEMLAPIGRIFVILAPLAGVYLIFVGIRDGLIRKRILSQKNPDLHDVGRQAVVRGLIFIVLGLVFIIFGTAGLIQGFG